MKMYFGKQEAPFWWRVFRCIVSLITQKDAWIHEYFHNLICLEDKTEAIRKSEEENKHTKRLANIFFVASTPIFFLSILESGPGSPIPNIITSMSSLFFIGSIAGYGHSVVLSYQTHLLRKAQETRTPPEPQ